MDIQKEAQDRLCVAMDVPDLCAARQVGAEIRGAVGYVKIGMELFTAEGPQTISAMHDLGFKVFLDLKFHDIPNTVAGAVRAAARHSVEIVDVHACGGRDMLRAAVDAAHACGTDTRPLVIGVTILTSIDQVVLNNELYVSGTVLDAVARLSMLSHEVGLDGVVASGLELRMLREVLPRRSLVIVPGVRPAGMDHGDQKRIIDPLTAIVQGADIIVVGRAVVHADDRRRVCVEIVSEIQRGMDIGRA